MLKESTAIASMEHAMRATMEESAIDAGIRRAKDGMLALQHDEGYWVFELEADCTIPSEYIIFMHCVDEIDELLQRKIARFLRAHQSKDGSYPLFRGGAGDISCTVKAYYALKLAGDSPDSPHMVRMREWLLARGGAARSNVFTRIMLAMFGQIPRRGVPFMPVEVMLFPKWFPFHLDKIAYWSRTVMVPLLLLYSHRVTAVNPLGISVRELFTVDPELEQDYFSHVKTPLGKTILKLERIGLALERFIPGTLRRKATQAAYDWMLPRMNGVDGLGAIYPAMANSYVALKYIDHPVDPVILREAKQSIENLLVIHGDTAYCQPCVSPIWDTGLTSLALQQTLRYSRDDALDKALHQALDWLLGKQIEPDAPGDWRVRCAPELKGGGWAFQFNNSYYPDVDDTAVVALALHQSGNSKYRESVRLAADWIAGMQSRNGGYGAFDADNDHEYLNHVPFADHGALLDPPTADVSARCAMFLAALRTERPDFEPVIARIIQYLRNEQEADGSWFGRWGTNYIYGTWSVLMAYDAAGISPADESVRRAVTWLKSVQRENGSWGEDNFSYHDSNYRGQFHHGSAFHTAIALIGLLSAGETSSPEVRKGIDYLLSVQLNDGLWHDEYFNAPGFPRVFYLKYHGYARFFPLWALSLYRNQTAMPA